MGWVVGGEQSIEYAVKSAFANEADIANLDGKGLSGIWLPQGVAESRMRDRELITKSVIVGHEYSKQSQEIWTFQGLKETPSQNDLFWARALLPFFDIQCPSKG